MKHLLLSILIPGCLLLAACSREAATPPVSKAPAGDLVTAMTISDAAWLAKARAEYPATTCLVTGDALGGMGPIADYVYKVAGQPDRLVRFCCKDCVSDFLKDADNLMARLASGQAPKAAAGAMHH